MVTDVNSTYCNGHFTMYTNVKSCCPPETNVMSITLKFLKISPINETQLMKTSHLMKSYTKNFVFNKTIPS